METASLIDSERERDIIEQTDAILIFAIHQYFYLRASKLMSLQAGLFAAFLPTFPIETLDLLERGPSGGYGPSNLKIKSATLAPFELKPFTPSASLHIVALNVLFACSLAIVIVDAFLSILAKGWVYREVEGFSKLRRRAIASGY